MANEINESRRSSLLSGPATLAACLLDIMETLYSRHLVLIQNLRDSESRPEVKQYWANLHDDVVEEFEDARNEWRPRLERMIHKTRNKE